MRVFAVPQLRTPTKRKTQLLGKRRFVRAVIDRRLPISTEKSKNGQMGNSQQSEGSDGMGERESLKVDLIADWKRQGFVDRLRTMLPGEMKADLIYSYSMLATSSVFLVVALIKFDMVIMMMALVIGLGALNSIRLHGAYRSLSRLYFMNLDVKS